VIISKKQKSRKPITAYSSSPNPTTLETRRRKMMMRIEKKSPDEGN
jgi:hypothetical protein